MFNYVYIYPMFIIIEFCNFKVSLPVLCNLVILKCSGVDDFKLLLFALLYFIHLYINEIYVHILDKFR